MVFLFHRIASSFLHTLFDLIERDLIFNKWKVLSATQAGFEFTGGEFKVHLFKSTDLKSSGQIVHGFRRESKPDYWIAEPGISWFRNGLLGKRSAFRFILIFPATSVFPQALSDLLENHLDLQ